MTIGPRVLVVDDEEGILRSLRRSLRRTAREIFTASSGAEGLEILQQNPGVEVVISDFRMPAMNGVEFLRRVKERWPKIQRIMLTGFADHRAIEDAINRSEIYRYIAKPWEESQLQMTVHSAHEQYTVLQENQRLLFMLQAEKEGLEAKVAQRTELLSAAKAEWELTFDAIQDPMAVVTAEGMVVRANLAMAAKAKLPIDQVPRQNCFEMVLGAPHMKGQDVIRHVVFTGETKQFTWRGDGCAYRIMIYRVPSPERRRARAVVYFRDVTEEERLTRQLIQTEKMAAVGQLAGGVAHEINNPLAGILAFSQMMSTDEGRDASDLEQLGYIESSAKRCMVIVNSLLSFSRVPEAGEREEICVRRLFEDTRVLASTLVKGTLVAVDFEHEVDSPVAYGSPNRLEQVIINLVTNAVQATQTHMEASGEREGRVRVRSSQGPRGLRVTVEDTGAGVPEALRERVFDPFFTTKPEGQGTGLGLAISYSIIEAHEGSMTVGQSEELGGARFDVDLPAQLGDA